MRRFASGLFPLDEALVDVALDLSGRPFVVWEVELPECLPLGNPAFDPQLAEHAVSSFATAAGITLHVELAAAATSTTSSRPRSRASPGACATRCASTAPAASRRRRASCDARSEPGPRRVAVLDYGIGNLHSAHKAIEHMGADARLTADPGLIADADGVVLPGVGAFGACMAALRAAGLEEPALDAVASGRPFLGICVGMQMLFDAQRGRRPARTASA